MQEKYDVWVVVPLKLEGGEVSNIETETEYVSATSADMGEIVAACQVLHPNLLGIEILPWEKAWEKTP